MSSGRKHITFGRILLRLVRFVLVTAVMSLLYYTLFALVFSTDTERRLIGENRLYSRTFKEMVEREKLVEDVIRGLQAKDNAIYKEIFKADAPGMDLNSDMDIISAGDSVNDKDLVDYTAHKIGAVEVTASSVEENLSKVMERLASSSDSVPPLRLPLGNVTYAQVGAGIGLKQNPFYKVESRHDGLDIIASQDDPVYATGRGIVSTVTRSRKGNGNVVEITHPGGYVTRYCHLGDIDVHRGQAVRAGKMIGKVGISGNAYAAHLHYEVLKDGVPVDPVNYFFASVDPSDYVKMMYMSAKTGQSLD